MFSWGILNIFNRKKESKLDKIDFDYLHGSTTYTIPTSGNYLINYNFSNSVEYRGELDLYKAENKRLYSAMQELYSKYEEVKLQNQILKENK